MLTPNDQQSSVLISALESAIDKFKKRGNEPIYANYRKSSEHHWPDDAANYKQALAAYNEAATKLAEATSKVDEWLPEPVRKALAAGEAFITRSPAASGGPISYSHILLDKPNGKYRVLRGNTVDEVVKKR